MRSIKRPSSRRAQRGSALLEAMFMIAVMGFASLMIIGTQSTRTDTAKDNAVAAQMKQMRDAVNLYVERNATALYSGATPVVLSVAALKAAGVLAPAFIDKNAWGQGYAVVIRRTGAQQLDGIIATTGGTPIPDARGTAIANMSGVSGGFIASTNATVAKGAGGGWQASLTPYAGAGYTPEAGHVVNFLWYEGHHLITDFVDRTGTPGQAEAAGMFTSLDMQSHNLQSVRDWRIGSAPVFGSTGQFNSSCGNAGEGTGRIGVPGHLLLCSTNQSPSQRWNLVVKPPTADCLAGYVHSQSGDQLICVEP